MLVLGAVCRCWCCCELAVLVLGAGAGAVACICEGRFFPDSEAMGFLLK